MTPLESDNVEIVRRAMTAAFRRPEPDFATINALYHPDHEIVSRLADVLGVPSLSGASGFRRWLDDTDEVWEWIELELEEVSKIDGERVLVTSRARARSRLGGVPLDQRFGSIVTVDDGKLVKTHTYRSVDEALEAANALDA